MEDVGRYRVTRRIAQGGMAEVFEGIALGTEGFQRRVAIKRMRAENAAEPSFGRMFLDEANIASQLHHASIVAVLDFGVSNGFPFQVLEFVDGLDVGRLVERGREAGHPLPVPLALAICTDIAHALEHAHRAVGADGRAIGIVHRDVSPANILVSWSGDVKLSDFGIAFARGRHETTSAGLTKGTLLYMAPEQIMRGEIDGRTDVFALGCVLHSLIAGASPLARENAMADLIAGTPLPVSRDLPDDIYDIVVRATRLAKADRFPSAGAMAEALGTALARRIERDPRSLMREWLARLRPAQPAGTAGKLDALLVFSGLKKSLPPGAMEVQQPRSVAADETSAPDRPARGRGPAIAILASAIIVASGIAVLGYWASAKKPSAVEVVGAQPSAPDAAALVLVPDATVMADASPPPDAAPADAAAPIKLPPPRVPRRPPPIEPVAAPSSARGTMIIAGDGALKAEILVDGKSRGFAPRSLELGVGTHQVVLVRPDGTRVTKAIDLLETHTPSAPLRWVVP